MKRHLLLTALIATPLYLRQREVEKRQRECRRAFDSELDHFAREVSKAYEDMGEHVGKQLNRFVNEINGELSRAGRP